MRTIYFLAVGVLLGITLFKSEAASWFRIYEMFQFDSFHMYGIIGTAVGLGVLVVQLIKRKKLKGFNGAQIQINPKENRRYSYLLGGILFGLGWALAGACPGPMFTLLGSGYLSMLVVIASGLLGTFVYGLIRENLPH
ncbi:DUF6691 family protein [Gilvibacter sp.]|uniref:DUF6691 family protein n=1 Tax=Gilvibacter sp. TaxID=2729997 RepID=UPI003F49D3BC